MDQWCSLRLLLGVLTILPAFDAGVRLAAQPSHVGQWEGPFDHGGCDPTGPVTSCAGPPLIAAKEFWEEQFETPLTSAAA